jgi:ATP/maltotriose-dependent transcriptional regulator MalT
MTELTISKLTAPKVKQEFIIRPRLIELLMEVT